MNRLEKKCLLGSAALHGLLVAVFLFGSAFFTPKPRKDSLPVINFIPDVLVDKELFGGGDPKVDPRAQPPPPPPPQQETKPPPPEPQPPKPEPPKKEVTPKQPDTRVADVPEEKRKTKETPPTNSPPKISTKLVVRNPRDLRRERQQQLERERDQALAERQRQWSLLNQKLSNVTRSLGSTLSTSTTIGIPGDGGLFFANYGQYVKSVYDAAWEVPEDMDDTDSTVKARVTIARDGTIRSAYIVTRSPNPTLNRSVQRALDEVKTIGKPFPEGAREDQRVFEINFNLKARRQHLG